MYLLSYRRKKENENRKERLLSYLPIKTVPEVLKILKAEGREANEYYFETKQEACDFSFNMPLYSMFRNVLFYIRKIKQCCAIIQSI